MERRLTYSENGAFRLCFRRYVLGDGRPYFAGSSIAQTVIQCL